MAIHLQIIIIIVPSESCGPLTCVLCPYLQELIDHVVAVAENTADELARSDGREVQLEEDPDLQLPFLLPEDGYSCDVVRSVPNGLQDFLDPLLQRGKATVTITKRSKKTSKASILRVNTSAFVCQGFAGWCPTRARLVPGPSTLRELTVTATSLLLTALRW